MVGRHLSVCDCARVRGVQPEAKALVELVSFSYPWQYSQNALAKSLWCAASVDRLSPPSSTTLSALVLGRIAASQGPATSTLIPRGSSPACRTVNFLLRLALHKVLPVLFGAHSFMMVQQTEVSYSEIVRCAHRTTVAVCVLCGVLMWGMVKAATALLMRLGWLQLV